MQNGVIGCDLLPGARLELGVAAGVEDALGCVGGGGGGVGGLADVLVKVLVDEGIKLSVVDEELVNVDICLNCAIYTGLENLQFLNRL